MPQHHGHRQYGGQRIGDALARDVRGRAVNGLVKAQRARAQTGRGQHADGAGNHGGLVRQDIPEQVAGQNHVKPGRIDHQLHGGVVHIQMAELNIRIFLIVYPGHHLTPQPGGGEHIGLVHRGHLARAQFGAFKGPPGDALDFMHAVAHLVHGRVSVLAAEAAAEIHVPGELAHHQHVQAVLYQFAFQRGGRLERGEQPGRAQVGVQPQGRADAQESGLGPLFYREIFPFGPAHRAQEHRVGPQAIVHRLLGQGLAGFVDGRAPDQTGLDAEFVAKLRARRGQHLERLGHDLRANAVARKNGNLKFHTFSPPPVAGSLSRPSARPPE